ncbi:MAG: response regulator transcription factor [Eubacterium sp.]|nr:response regulator transcription factor [Eubacterium sp.]
MNEKIMIIDDDVDIGNMLEEALSKASYRVIRAYSGTEALMVLERENPDLILLDLMLPGLSGEDLLPKLNNTLTIVMSAKTDINNKVNLLYNGASDYVTKPFVISELLARISALLKLSSQKGISQSTPDDDTDDNKVKVGNLCLDLEFLTISVSDSTNNSTNDSADIKEASLTRTEAAILNILMQNANHPLGRNTILDKISDSTPDCTERSLKQHISNIRKKIEALDGIDHIEAIYGIGFKFNN